MYAKIYNMGIAAEHYIICMALGFAGYQMRKDPTQFSVAVDDDDLRPEQASVAVATCSSAFSSASSPSSSVRSHCPSPPRYLPTRGGQQRILSRQGFMFLPSISKKR